MTSRCTRVFQAGLVAALLVAAPGPRLAAAQVLALELNLSDPGGRSLAFGGAFVALADDATAAFANPAGLTQLVEPELSVEWRVWEYTTEYTHGGRANGEPTGYGIDTLAGLSLRESCYEVSGVSFLSLVYPAGRWSFALYSHRLADFRHQTETNGLFGTDPDTGATLRIADRMASTSLDMSSVGLAVAFRVTDWLSLGAGLVSTDCRFTTSDLHYLWDEDTIESFFSENSFLPSRLISTTTATVDDTSLAYHLGVLAHPSERWRLGAFYRSGTDFDFLLAHRPGPLGEDEPSGELPLRVDFPSEYGVGAAFRTRSGHITVSFEWDHVQYSALLDSLRPFPIDPDEQLSDADELHLGFELALLDSHPVIALRLGTWLDPDHRIRSEGGDDYSAALLRPGSDELHATAGFGLTWKKLQIDLGFDLSEAVTTAAISAIYKY